MLVTNTKRAPRAPRAQRRTRTRDVVEVRLSAERRAWVDFVMEKEGDRSPAALIRNLMDSLAESDDSKCLDPTKSKFRAWKLEREGRTSRIRCGWDGDVPRFCRPCSARYADALRRVAADRRRRARRAA